MEKPVPHIFLRVIRLPLIHFGVRLSLRVLKKRYSKKIPSEIPAAVESFFVHDLIDNIDTNGDGKVDSFRLAITNAWFNQNITGLQIHINGKKIDPARVLIDNDFAKVRGDKLKSLRFIAGHPFTLTVEKKILRRGLHFIGLELECDLANVKIPILPILVKKGKLTIPLLDDPWDKNLSPNMEEGENSRPAVVHFCPHIHYDYEWLRTADTFSKVAVGNLEEAISILKKNPESTFVIDQTPQLLALKKDSPESYATLISLIKEGRVEAALGGYVEPDTNLPLGESLVRQFIRWQRYSKIVFGDYSKTAWLIDSFGMSGQLPQILRKCAANALMYSRKRPADEQVKADFWWQGIDGTPIKTHHMAQFYFAGYPVDSDPKRALYRFYRNYKRLAKSSDQHNLFCPSGVDHGQPQQFAPSIIKEWAKENFNDVSYKYSTPAKYLESLDEDEFKSFEGELNGEMTGVNAARIDLKQLSREAENELLEAEALTAINHILGQNPITTQTNMKSLSDGWELVLKSHFHDSITGCNTDEVAGDIRTRLERAKRISGQVLNYKIQALAKRVLPNVKGNGAYFVFNPTCNARRENIEIELRAVNGNLPYITDGKRYIAYQVLSMERFHDNSDKRAKVCFTALVPPLGYQVYYITNENGFKKPRSFFPVKTNGHVMENGQIQIRFSKKSGAISHVIGKEDGRIWELGDSGALHLRKDRGTLYQEFLTGFTKKQKCKKFQVLEQGPLKGVIETEGIIGKSSYKTTYTICSGSPQVFVHTKVNYNDPGKTLFANISKDPYPFTVKAEIPFGNIQREPGSGIAQNYFYLRHNNERSMSVFNKGTPGYLYNEKQVKMTLHRSVDKIHFFNAGHGALGLGQKTFDYALRFSHGELDVHQPWRFGQNFNHPLIVHKMIPDQKSNTNDMPKKLKHSFAIIDQENIVVTSIAPENDGAITIRCYEAAGKSTEANLRLGFKINSAQLTDMLGRKADDLEIDDNSIPLSFRKFEIKTIKIEPRIRKPKSE